VFYKNESEHVIERPGTDQRIKAKTAWNADTLRGDYADLLILDEWQLMDETFWEDVGAPMLLDNHGERFSWIGGLLANEKSTGRPAPPPEHRWKKGVSGNPRGRPKKQDSLTSQLHKEIKKICPADRQKRTWEELMVLATLQLAMKGNAAALKEFGIASTERCCNPGNCNWEPTENT
jgi:hypothetical protein